MKLAVEELSGLALDLAVEKARFGERADLNAVREGYLSGAGPYYSTLWKDGGPVIESYHIELNTLPLVPVLWYASINGRHRRSGLIPLVAAMRCLVQSKFGHTIDVPEELL